MNRVDLQFLARARLAEAKALLDAGRTDGAYYLAGYAVECALKACIARETLRYDFPEKRRVNASHTHDLKELIKVAKLQVVHKKEVDSDPVFRNYWEVVQEWSEESRYHRNGPEVAREIVEAIGDRRHGVISWIKRHW